MITPAIATPAQRGRRPVRPAALAAAAVPLVLLVACSSSHDARALDGEGAAARTLTATGDDGVDYESHWDALPQATRDNNCRAIAESGIDRLISGLYQSGVTGWNIETIRGYVEWIVNDGRCRYYFDLLAQQQAEYEQQQAEQEAQWEAERVEAEARMAAVTAGEAEFAATIPAVAESWLLASPEAIQALRDHGGMTTDLRLLYPTSMSTSINVDAITAAACDPLPEVDHLWADQGGYGINTGSVDFSCIIDASDGHQYQVPMRLVGVWPLYPASDRYEGPAVTGDDFAIWDGPYRLPDGDGIFHPEPSTPQTASQPVLGWSSDQFAKYARHSITRDGASAGGDIEVTCNTPTTTTAGTTFECASQRTTADGSTDGALLSTTVAITGPYEYQYDELPPYEAAPPTEADPVGDEYSAPYTDAPILNSLATYWGNADGDALCASVVTANEIDEDESNDQVWWDMVQEYDPVASQDPNAQGDAWGFLFQECIVNAGLPYS